MGFLSGFSVLDDRDSCDLIRAVTHKLRLSLGGLRRGGLEHNFIFILLSTKDLKIISNFCYLKS